MLAYHSLLDAMTITTFPALLASAVFLARLLPQPVRTLRTGQVTGVSVLAAMNACIADIAWLVYGLTSRVVTIWLVCIPAIAASAGTVWVLRRLIARRDLVASAIWLAAVGLAAWSGALTFVLAGTVLVSCGPSLWSAFRSDRPVGIAPGTWLIALADAATWGLYGLAISNLALELYAVVLLATAVAILSRLRWTSSLVDNLPPTSVISG
ncbi:MAG TPA: hypothetical protein VG435_17160 [Acidimicrobiales bacterium]|jgi:uncharacterized protein with PQ loop repeat|nr:hypothetical protein [Acidimicrobiales bacterium]